MIQAAHKTIGEIAAANPATVKVFQKYDIDFRCGGKRPLDEVCAEKGIMERVVKNHGVRHGDSLFPLQQSFLALKDELEVHLRKEEMVLFPHILQTEEARRTNTPGPCSCFGSIENPIRMMEYEHENAGQALRRMRALTGDYTLPGDAGNGYRSLFHDLQALEADLHVHIYTDNNVLHPRARLL